MVDLSVFPGTWLNTNWETQGIAQLVLSIEDGELSVHVYGVGPDGLIDWGLVKGATVYCSKAAANLGTAFAVRYDLGFMDALLQGNLNRGVLVLATHNAFKDGSGRLSYFSREYFSRVRLVSECNPTPPSQERRSLTDVLPSTPVSLMKIARTEDLLFGTAQDPGPLDPGPTVGRWSNTNDKTRGLKEITIERNGEKPILHVMGVGCDGLVDWGRAEAGVYRCIEEDGHPSVVLSATYDLEFMETHFQIRLNKGVLVAANFNVFKDHSGRSNYFLREFFHRQAHEPER